MVQLHTHRHTHASKLHDAQTPPSLTRAKIWWFVRLIGCCWKHFTTRVLNWKVNNLFHLQLLLTDPIIVELTCPCEYRWCEPQRVFKTNARPDSHEHCRVSNEHIVLLPCFFLLCSHAFCSFDVCSWNASNLSCTSSKCSFCSTFSLPSFEYVRKYQSEGPIGTRFALAFMYSLSSANTSELSSSWHSQSWPPSPSPHCS